MKPQIFNGAERVMTERDECGEHVRIPLAKGKHTGKRFRTKRFCRSGAHIMQVGSEGTLQDVVTAFSNDPKYALKLYSVKMDEGFETYMHLDLVEFIDVN